MIYKCNLPLVLERTGEGEAESAAIEALLVSLKGLGSGKEVSAVCTAIGDSFVGPFAGMIKRADLSLPGGKSTSALSEDNFKACFGSICSTSFDAIEDSAG